MKNLLQMLTMVVLTLSVIGCGGTISDKMGVPAPPAEKEGKPAVAALSETEVKRLVDELGAAVAKNDMDALGKVYADDYVLIGIDGKPQTKQERLEAGRSGQTVFEEFTYSDTKVRVYGDSAVANTVATLKGKSKGQLVDGKAAITLVVKNTNDGPRIVSGHATMLPADPGAGENK